MHFIVDKSSIYKALSNVKTSLQTRGSVPILSCVKMDARDGALSLTATNHETETIESIDAQILENGSVAIPMETLLEIIKHLDEDKPITVRLQKNNAGEDNVVIESSVDSYKINHQPSSDFPLNFPELHEESILLKARTFNQLIKRVTFAMSQSPERYNLNGLYVTTKNENNVRYLCCVATDGHRLAFAKEPVSSEIEISGIIIPKKAVSEMEKLTNCDGDCAVVVSKDKSKMSIKIGRLRFSAKLLDATFPDWTKVVPQNTDKVLEVGKGALLSKIRAASSTTKGKGVKFVLSQSSFELIGRGPSGETSNVHVSPHTFTGEDNFVTVYNPTFVDEALGHFEDRVDKVRMSFSDPLAQTLLEDPDNKAFFYVIMPMKNED